MNKIHRIVWCKKSGHFVVVAENAKSHSKGSSGSTLTSGGVGGTLSTSESNFHFFFKPIWQAFVAAGLCVGFWLEPALAQTPPKSQLPVGGYLSAGQASISQSGAAMAITQASQRAALNWQSFNVGAAAKVNIIQPSSSSVLLNRVLSSTPSQIFGQINANGHVILTNPSGVYFAPGASVDVGSFTATTHGISDTDFMAGSMKFNRNGATGQIINDGTLTASLGGYIALLAPEVRNNGIVIAKMGTVALAAGESFELQFDKQNSLANIVVTPATVAALVENGNAVQAPGGLIILSAQAANQLLSGVVKNSGTLQASGLEDKGGVIRLRASQSIVNTGTVLADAAAASAGKGGDITAIADLSNTASTITVDGTWRAQGGALGGNGGFIETSASQVSVQDGAKLSTLAPKGTVGTWLCPLRR